VAPGKVLNCWSEESLYFLVTERSYELTSWAVLHLILCNLCTRNVVLNCLKVQPDCVVEKEYMMSEESVQL